MQIGSTVRKKSRKPFQNREKFAVIESFTTMTVPLGGNRRNETKTIDAVLIVGCKGLVELSILEEIS